MIVLFYSVISQGLFKEFVRGGGGESSIKRDHTILIVER